MTHCSTLTILLLSSALMACSASDPAQPAAEIEAETEASAPAAAETKTVSLTEQWVLTGFDAPESVIPTRAGDSYYVSNVGGEGSAEDNNGAIALISKDGTMLNRTWVTGTDAVPLHAPKGMALISSDKGDVLLVTDIDHVAFIRVDESRIAKRLPAPGANFLNDIAEGPVTDAGHKSAFISDSANARIYQLANDEITVWLEDERLGGVNGLQMDGGRLLVTTMSAGELLSVDLETKAITGIASGMDNADGIGQRADGSYIISSWPGQLWHVREGEAPTLLQDTTGDTPTFMNDIFLEGDVLVTPNWMPGTVRAYGVE